MSAIANITVFDGAGTPVSHIFVPTSVSKPKNGVVEALWRETGLAVPTIAQPRLKLIQERTKAGVWVTKRTSEIPVMEAVNGQNAAGYTAQPKVAHTVTDVRTQLAHERSDSTIRRLSFQLGTNLDGNIATTVTPFSAGPMYEAFVLQVMPT